MRLYDRRMSFAMRLAAPEDAHGLAEVHVRAWRAAYAALLPVRVLRAMSVEQREAAWRQILQPVDSRRVLVVEDHGTIVGFAVLETPSRDADAGEAVAELAAINVDPDRWSMGVGTALMDAAVFELLGHKWREWTLWVLSENRRAQEFYRRWGFSPDGTVRTEEGLDRPELRLHALVERRKV